MPTEPVLWVREDHTKAKHELLLAFFNKWVSIHSEHFTVRRGGLVRVYDGFAGPGVYEGGEAGSPRIMLEALLSNPNLLARWTEVTYEFSFVEQDPRRAKRLTEELEALEAAARSDGRWTDRVTWSVTCGRYEEHVPQPVQGLSALFLFLDPFGYSHAPMTLTTELVQQPKSDTLIFLPLSFVNRFAGREGQETALDRFFGTSRWREVPDGPGRPAALLDLFQEQLAEAGLGWTGRFRLKPPEAGNEYFIVGASGHPSGYESIKEGFWAVDAVHGEGFVSSRPAPEGQQALDIEFADPKPDTGELLLGLKTLFGDAPFTVEEALEYTQTTKYLKTHLKRMTLTPAAKRGDLEVKRPPGVKQFPEGRGITLRFVR
ncbi:MAG: three-Cys-motif partner protein TcmP [Solirubrobacteraceae bacterium]